jgi:hypothetical protein
MNPMMGTRADLAFVGRKEVEDRKERLAGSALPPMGLPGRFVPGTRRLFEIVVLLVIVGAVITGFAKVAGNT